LRPGARQHNPRTRRVSILSRTRSNNMNSRLPRSAVVAAAFVIAAGCALVVALVRHGGGGHVPPPGRCEVSSTRALTPDASDRIVGIAHHQGTFWALAVHRSGASRVAQLLRSTSGRDAPAPVATSAITAGSAVVGPVFVPDGVAFAAAAGPVIRATAFNGRTARSVELPRGESPLGRDGVTPRLSLTTEDDGTLTVAAHWGGRFGTRRLHARDTHESIGLGPRRRDRFDAPALTALGDSLLVLHERRIGTFTDDTSPASSLEAVAFPAGPFDPAPPRDVVVSSTGGAAPRVVSVEGGAVALWHEGARLVAARLDVTGAAVTVSQSPVAIEADSSDRYDLAAGAGACAAAVVAASREFPSTVKVHGLRVDGTTLVDAGSLTSSDAGMADTNGLHIARVGGGLVLVALFSDHSVRAWRLDLSATCVPTMSPLPLPTAPIHGAGLRVIALSGDATGATLLLSRDPLDATTTEVTRVEIDPAFHVAAPVTEAVPQSVTAGARYDARIAMVAGPSRGTVRAQRLGDPGDDDEPGEDILLRQARGERIAMYASAERHRIWIADRSDDRSNPFHPPHAVVVHSVIDTLEDGPRTEVATAAPPEAEFATVALHRFEAPAADRPAWALVTAPEPAAQHGLDGAWVFLFDPRDEAIARTAHDDSPLPNAAPLLPAAMSSPRDRVSSVAWRGTTLAAVVSGPRAGVRLVTGDPFTGSLRDAPLCDTPATMIRGATVLPHGDGWIAFWLDVTHPQPTLRDRRFHSDGSPRGAPETLGEFLHLDDAALPTSLPATTVTADEFAVAVPTPHGVRLAEVRCTR